jgi:hypothetical protein
MVQLPVRTPTGKTFLITVDSNASVLEVKQQILNSEGFPVYQQELMWAGNVLDNSKSFSEYNVSQGTVLMLVLKSINCRNPEVFQDHEQWSRTPYHPLPVVTHPRIPLPFCGRGLEQADFFVWCQANKHIPTEQEYTSSLGETPVMHYPQELQHGKLRIRCRNPDCFIPEAVTLISTITDWMDIYENQERHHLRGMCYGCATTYTEDGDPIPEEGPVEIVIRCGGQTETGNQCKSESGDGTMNTIPIPGVFTNHDGIPSIDSAEADIVQLACHPHGHRFFARDIDTDFRNAASRVARNGLYPQILGNFVLRCAMPQCDGVFYRPACKLAGPETFRSISEWHVKEIVLQNPNGVLCPKCKTAFYSGNGPKNDCPECKYVFCEQHQCEWGKCDSAVIQIPLVFEKSRYQRCPQCGFFGQKDDECTHIPCPACQTSWCYCCENRLVNNSCPTGCCLILNAHPLLQRFEAGELVLQFHRFKCIRLLQELRLRFNQKNKVKDFDTTYAKLIKEKSVINSLLFPPISLEEICKHQVLPNYNTGVFFDIPATDVWPHP